MRYHRLQRSHGLVLGLAGVVALAGYFSCGGGKQSGQGSQGFSRCIEDWPSANGPHPTKPSLNVEAPKVVWRTEVPWSFTVPDRNVIGPVVSRDRLAFPTTDYVFFVGKDGSTPQRVGFNALGEPPSGLVADPDGNIYYVTEGGVYSVDATGKLRWHRSLGGSRDRGEYAPSYPPVLDPDGVVYAATSSEKVYALRTSDGSTIWSQTAPGNSVVLGGAGKGLFLSRNGEQVDVLDTVNGKTIGTLRTVIDGKVSPVDSPIIVLGWQLGIVAQGAFVFDGCGRLRWSTYDELRRSIISLGLLTPGELVVSAGSVYDGEKWLKTNLRLYDTEGNVAVTSTSYQGYGYAIGGDGTIYMVGYRTIVAYSMDLNEQWSLDLGSGAGIREGLVLDEDGMMYVMHQSESTGTELVAIQTRSPGLADSSWPSIRHDNRGTAWLVPGVPSGPAPSP